MRRTLALLLLAATTLRAGAQESSLLRRGRELYAQGRYELAADALERASLMGPVGPGDLALLGFAYLQLNRLAEAERAVERALQAGPREAIVRLAAGQLAFLKDDYAQAVEHFRAALERVPASTEARKGLAASLINLGIAAYRGGRPDEAAARFREALDCDPLSVPALQNLALLELEAGRNAEAEPLVERALALEPSSPSALRLLVRLRERQGRLVEALEPLQTLSRLAPEDPVTAALYGRALEQSGRDREAMEAFGRAEERDTEDAYPYYRLARAAADRGERERALVLARQAIGKAVQHAALLQMQAVKRMQAAGGKLRPADVEELERLARLGEEPTELLGASLALLRSLHADARAYENDLRLLCSWYPHSRPVLAALGDLLLEQKRWEEALAHWHEVAALMATAKEAHIGIARSLEGGGRIEEARQAWVRALDLEAKDPAVFDALERTFGDGPELRQILLDRSYIETRNTLLLRRLAALERRLGLADAADKREQRIRDIEQHPR